MESSRNSIIEFHASAAAIVARFFQALPSVMPEWESEDQEWKKKKD